MARNLVAMSDEFSIVGICARKTVGSDKNHNNFYVLLYFWLAQLQVS